VQNSATCKEAGADEIGTVTGM